MATTEPQVEGKEAPEVYLRGDASEAPESPKRVGGEHQVDDHGIVLIPTPSSDPADPLVCTDTVQRGLSLSPRLWRAGNLD
jgi:hypothetical protein